MNNKENETLVSVCIITYNHELFISKAVDSIIRQKVNFFYEIVIGDDCSTDQTKDILAQYQKQYPNTFRIKFHKHNLGVVKNFADTIQSCKGKYIALLEGDDYWIDDDKLQKQVDYLEENISISLCCTNSVDLNQKTGIKKRSGNAHPPDITLCYLLEKGWFIRTATIMFRRNLLTKFPEWFYTAYSTDYILQVLLADKGDITKLDDYTAVYRIHEGGISQANTRLQVKRWIKKIELLSTIDQYFEHQFSYEIYGQKSSLNFSIIETVLRSNYNLFDKFKILHRFKDVTLCTISLRFKAIVNNLIPL